MPTNQTYMAPVWSVAPTSSSGMQYCTAVQVSGVRVVDQQLHQAEAL